MKQKELQRNLFIEYALGEKTWKKYPLVSDTAKYHTHVAPYLIIEQPTQFTGTERVSFDINLVKRETEVNVPMVQEMMQQDNGYVKYLVGLKYYLDNPKNYIFSPYLTSLLKGTCGDVDCRFLHKKHSGYIEMPDLVDRDGDKVLGILFHIDKTDVWLMRIVWLLENEKSGGMVQSYFFENIDEGTITQIATRNKYQQTKVRKINGELQLCKEEDQDNQFGNLELTTINAILWILHKKDMVEKLNEFAQKKSKREVEEKLYTQKSFYECDMERSFTVDSSFTKGHMRWQPYGPMIEKQIVTPEGTTEVTKVHSEIKLIYIQPYTRELKKYDKKEEK